MVADFLSFLAQTGITTILIVYIFALWAALTVWTWFDVSVRTGNVIYRLGAIILVALGFILGFILYIVLRPAHTKNELEFRILEEKIFESQSKSSLCYNCGSVLEPEFLYCATCGVKVKKVCVSCEREISHAWNVCPYCSALQKEIKELEVKEVRMKGIVSTNVSRFAVFSFLKRLSIPKVSLLRGGKKRGRPRKEKQETSPKRPRGRPRKEITQFSSEA